MAKKIEYSALIGLSKTAKNSAYLLIPFVLALLVDIPAKYAWLAGPMAYFLKNYYETKAGKKI